MADALMNQKSRPKTKPASIQRGQTDHGISRCKEKQNKTSDRGMYTEYVDEPSIFGYARNICVTTMVTLVSVRVYLRHSCLPQPCFFFCFLCVCVCVCVCFVSHFPSFWTCDILRTILADEFSHFPPECERFSSCFSVARGVGAFPPVSPSFLL